MKVTDVTEEMLLTKHPFQILRQIDVNHLVQSKNGMKYLPWCDALDTLLSLYPESNFKNILFGEEKLPYLKTESGVFVEVEVCVRYHSKKEECDLIQVHHELFPVMDFRNKAIMNPNVFDINKSLKRALSKCIANHGLGLYIYQGEELPLSNSEALEESKNELIELLKKNKKYSDAAAKAIPHMNYEQVMGKIAEYK